MKKSMFLSQTIIVCFLLLLFLAGQTFAAQVTYTASKATRGTTVNISESVINSYCGDGDGCTMRLGMYNWDGTRRTASREFLFYYDWGTTNWRASNDSYGTNHLSNNSTQHVYHAWSCYFTDGYYDNWTNHGDFSYDFGLLSWNQYNADCKLTIID